MSYNLQPASCSQPVFSFLVWNWNPNPKPCSFQPRPWQTGVDLESSCKVWSRRKEDTGKEKEVWWGLWKTGIDLHCLAAPNISVGLIFSQSTARCLWNCLNTEKYLLSSQCLKFRGRLFRLSPWWRLKLPCTNVFEFLAMFEDYFTQISHPFDAPIIWNSDYRGPTLKKEKISCSLFGHPQIIIPYSNVPRPNLASSSLECLISSLLPRFYPGINRKQ